MSKEEVMTILETFKTSGSKIFARFTYSREWRPGDSETVIGLFQEIDKFGYVLIGHPYNLKKEFMTAGQMGCFPSDITNIETVTKEEFLMWVKDYKSFHKSVMEEKGYDFCMEDLSNVKLFSKADEK